MTPSEKHKSDKAIKTFYIGFKFKEPFKQPVSFWKKIKKLINR